MVMKKRILSLRIIFFEYLFGMALMFVLSFSIPFALFNLGINTGLYTYANFSEIQAKNMEHKIAEANPFNSALVPASCTYVYVSPDYAVLQSNMMQEEMKNAVAYAQGKYSPPTNDDCFFVIKRDDGFCILHYYIRSRYTVDWMNRYLPSMDVLLIVTKLDRIARSTIHGAQLVEELIGRGVRLNILNMGIMDDTPSSKLIRGVGVYMSGPAIETVPADYQKIMNGELNDKLVDLTGDIEYIESVGELYILKIKTQDGDYIAYTTKDVAGQFPREGDKRVKMYISPSYDENGELVITIISFHK